MRIRPTISLLLALALSGACSNESPQQAGEASPPAGPPADVDPYFSESSAVSSETAPPVITRHVLQDRKGGFWLATWNGIVRFDGEVFTNVTNQEGLRRYRAFSLHVLAGAT